MKQIITSFQDQIGTITFNNDEKRNALSFGLLDGFQEAFKEFRNKQARVVIIRAKKGSKVWSAGLFIDELPKPGEDPLPFDHPLESILRTVEHFPAPVIAMAEGSIWGGACDLATVCDIIVGTEKTTMAITPARLGVPYNSSGILHIMEVFGLHTAKEMFYTALPISAQRALQLGVINHLVSPNELEGFTYDLAKKMCENSPLAISVIKEQITELAESQPLTASTFERINRLRYNAFSSEDYVEGQRAFQEKRKALFKGK
nr:methylmalonyl-CoA decarboxylase [Bacteroidota bacterium]